MYEYEILDVFTEKKFGGNPLAVFPAATEIPDSLYQSIAREINLSETVFVLPAEDSSANFRFRIFTPVRELDFAGHPVVGTACALAARQSENPYSFVAQLNVGLARMDVRMQHTVWEATFQVPRMPEQGPPPPSPENLSRALNLAEDEILRTGAYSCGAPILFLELASRDALSRAKLDLALFQEFLQGYWAQEIMPFFREEYRIHARMFAPALGIPEDPATGGAAAALAGYLNDNAIEDEAKANRTLSWEIHQGHDMGRPSLIELEFSVENREVKRIQLTGKSVPIARGSFLNLS